jgi:hypothetical protein
LQPRGSIKAPSFVVNTDNTFGRRLSLNVSGRQCIRMDNGTEMEFCPGDVAIIDPGHDGWVVGDEPNVLFELAEATRE